MISLSTISSEKIARWQSAAPFWISLLLLPLFAIACGFGGLWVLIVPISTWYLFGALDAVIGLQTGNADPDTADDEIRLYTLVTLIWAPLQFITLFGAIYYVPRAEHLGLLEAFMLCVGAGVITGTIGINYSHELMHQKSKTERWMADILLAMVLYSHFRSEHLLVHHRYVGTPRDPVTARYNENFHRFFPRVVKDCWRSAFKAEKEMLARKDLPWTDLSNPFMRYWALQAGMLLLAVLLSGFAGLVFFLFQAFVAIWQLELVNYVEHYGLTRKHLGDGKYEHVQPRHSWNASQKASNWLLINLQRHSDHHYKPNRRFPLLQNYTEADAPQLPFGYPVMTLLALYPKYWRRVMNPRVQRWREMYYPEITEWRAYNKALNPMPR